MQHSTRTLIEMIRDGRCLPPQEATSTSSTTPISAARI